MMYRSPAAATLAVAAVPLVTLGVLLSTLGDPRAEGTACRPSLPSIELQDGDRVSGKLLVESLVLPVGASVLVTDDLSVESQGDILILGTLQALDRSTHATKAHAPNITLRAAGHIDVPGQILGGRGKGYDGADPARTSGGPGGDGSSIALIAHYIFVDGRVVGGAGGPGGASAPGGAGGDISFHGHFLTRRSDGRATAIGGAGGPGGVGTCLPDGSGGRGGHGGRAGNVIIEREGRGLSPEPCCLEQDPLRTALSRIVARSPLALASPQFEPRQCQPGNDGARGGSSEGGNGGPGADGAQGTDQHHDGWPGGKGGDGGDAAADDGMAGTNATTCCTTPSGDGNPLAHPAGKKGGDGGPGGNAKGGTGGKGGDGGNAYKPGITWLGNGGNAGNGGNGGDADAGSGKNGGNGSMGCPGGNGGAPGAKGSYTKGDKGPAGAPGQGLNPGHDGSPGGDGGWTEGTDGMPGYDAADCSYCETHPDLTPPRPGERPS